MYSYVPKLNSLFYLTALLIDFFPVYRTFAASSDEMELWSSLDDSSQLQTLNLFHIGLCLILSVIQIKKQKTMQINTKNKN